MADVTFTVTESVKAGIMDVSDILIAPYRQLGDAAGTDDFLMPNDGKTFLLIVGGAAASDIVFTQVKDKYGRSETTHLTFDPALSKTSLVGPFLPELWNQHGGLLKFKPAAPVTADVYLAVRVANPT